MPQNYNFDICLILNIVGELGGQIVHRIDCRSCFHGGWPIQKSPVTCCGHLHQEDLQQDFGKFLAHTHPGAPSKWDVLEPRVAARKSGHETLWLEGFLVRKDLCHIMGVADTVNDVPAFGNLVSLKSGRGNDQLSNPVMQICFENLMLVGFQKYLR